MDPYLSRTLQSLTRSKIYELEKQRDAYEQRKFEALADADQCPTLRERVEHLLVSTRKLLPALNRDADILNIEHWVDQARFDSSIPTHKLEGFEKYLRNKLEPHSRKLQLADLYSRLLTEWMNPPSREKENQETASDDSDGFLVVEERQKQRLQQLCDQFESMVFKSHETDAFEINAFLDALFPDEEQKQLLKNFRDRVSRATESIWEREDPFTVDSLSACIRGIQCEEIVTDEKQETLKHFVNNKVALSEIADVLNMRYADLDNWDWHTGEEGVPVLPRQQLNGKYRIWMDDDILETIFVEHICIRLCRDLKSTLTSLISDKRMFNFVQGHKMTKNDRIRRRYYAMYEASGSTAQKRRDDYFENFFLAAMPEGEDTLGNRFGGYDDDLETHESSAPKSVKQKLLRKIVTETLLKRHLNGEAAVIQTDLQWYATSIPHSTVYAFLAYAGFSDRWINFFRKYLETPLNMDQAFDGHEKLGPRKRRRGIPIAHASEKLIGELILFFMDLAVNKGTGILLYRLHDDIWLSGESEKCIKAWDIMQNFAQITGLEFNRHKSGSAYLGDSMRSEVISRLPEGPVRIGFLMLDASSGEWVIDHSQVDAHVRQLKTQLDQCDSIISWIRTWNSCIGRFFKNTFGEPAYCFGRPHIDAILSTYEKMHKTIFETAEKPTQCTVAGFLRQKIESRFGTLDVPDAFFYLPEKLGGLGLRNPFISISLIRKQLNKTPTELVDDYLSEELSSYENAKMRFEKTTRKDRRALLEQLQPDRAFENLNIIAMEEIDQFMSIDEWNKLREEESYCYSLLYEELMNVPTCAGPRTTTVVDDAISDARENFGLGRLGIETKWILGLYAEELMRDFGGLNLVDKQYLPMGVLDMIKGKKVRWQMVL
ncbi:reverse transcriptase [Penicillium manginii]|uniref:reverse transcriptase n=1 Tax=Penicillium manginii TaxID=203109 RepID=UPI0025482503|nr:reverse transcriptase [Penicillium manginii]KAJ5756079.1 reverse transcriptase [Penicillium manginii]